MKKHALRSGTRVRLLSYEQGYPEGSIFVVSSLWRHTENNYEYSCYLESNHEKICNLFDDEFEVI